MPKPTEPIVLNDSQQAYLDRLLSVGEECISPSEMATLVARQPTIFLYDGFEPSGRMHIAQGVFKARNVNLCVSRPKANDGDTNDTSSESPNVVFQFWVADWFALMNDKMGGDLDKIRTVGHYLMQVWKAAGMQLDNVQFLWASDEITSRANEYWPLVLDVARRFTVSRIQKCCQIMGRKEGTLSAAQVLYPLMQCTDVFFLQTHICQLGVDQRKVNMLAREYADAAKRRKPVILSHHMLYGLKQGQEKMSKSDPDSAVFMEDAAEDVERKILKAYCPRVPDETAAASTMQIGIHDQLKNPCLDYIQHILFGTEGATFVAGGTVYTSYADVQQAFVSEQLSETDLKRGLIDALNALLEPVRQHFATGQPKELLEKVRQYKRESATSSTNTTVRRLQLKYKNCHLVLVPPPTPNPTLQSALHVLCHVQAAAVDQSVVLWCADWSATVLNACLAEPKAIQAYYDVFLQSLRALGMPQSVEVVYQSQAILQDPSNYWISVINVGRHFMLQQVLGDLPESTGVGVVIARLLTVADVLAVEPGTVCIDDETVRTLLETSSYWETIVPGVAQPQLVTDVVLPNVRLQAIRASAAEATEHDEYFLLDDAKVHGKSKLKKAFCEPGNTDFCPPIALATQFMGDGLVVDRAPENGGSVTYTSRSQLETDFASGALHPGDLKGAVQKVMVSVLESLGLDKKVTKDLKACAKKMAKMKK